MGTRNEKTSKRAARKAGAVMARADVSVEELRVLKLDFNAAIDVLVKAKAVAASALTQHEGGAGG
jgi:hypothetical protein